MDLLLACGGNKLLLRIASGDLQTADVREATRLALAYPYDEGRKVLAILSIRQNEILNDYESLSRFIKLAEKTITASRYTALLKAAYRRHPTRTYLFSFLGSALRRERRLKALNRLILSLEKRFNDGVIPLLQFIRIMRRLDFRAPIFRCQALVDTSGDRLSKIEFIEAAVDVMDFERAMSLMQSWGVNSDALSKKARRELKHFRVRALRFNRHTLTELQADTVSRLATRRKVLPQDHPLRSSGEKPTRLLVTASSLGIGGAERQLSLLVNHLAKLPGKFEIVVFVMERRSKEYVIDTSPNIKVVYRDDVSVAQKIRPSIVPRHLAKDLEIFLRRNPRHPLLGVAQAFKPDVIFHAVGLPTDTLMAGYLLGIPHIVVRFGGLSFYNDFTFSDRQENNFRIAEFCCRLLAPGVRFVTNSAAASREWAGRFNIPSSSVRVIPNAIALPAGDPEGHGCRKRLFGSDACKVIGFAGRFHNVKRPELWLEVAFRLAKRDPDIRFLMIGDGALRSPLMKRVAESAYKGRFVFTGLLISDIELHYQAMDVLLMTSETESFPNVAVEALSQGAYVVAPPVGDLPAIVEGDLFGRLYEKPDADSILAVVEDVLANHDFISSTRSRRAAETQRRFDLASMLGSYTEELSR